MTREAFAVLGAFLLTLLYLPLLIVGLEDLVPEGVLKRWRS